MFFLLASSFFFAVDDVVVAGVWRRFGGDWGLGIGGCDEEEGTPLVECGEVLIEWCGLMGRKVRDYGWEGFSCDDEDEERKEEEGLIRTMA